MAVRWKDKALIGALADDDTSPVTDTSDGNTDKRYTPQKVFDYITGKMLPASSADNAIVRFDGTSGNSLQGSKALIDDAGNVTPSSNDGSALGKTSLKWSDAFFAAGAVVNFNSGNFTITHSAGLLTFSGNVSLGTGNALTAGTMELGHASDTTLSRAAAGVLAVEGVRLAKLITSDQTYNIPTDYATLQAAVDDLSQHRVKQGAILTLNIESGHALTAGLSLTNGDYSHFRIVSEDDIVPVDAGFGSEHIISLRKSCTGPSLFCCIDAGGNGDDGIFIVENSSMYIEGDHLPVPQDNDDAQWISTSQESAATTSHTVDLPAGLEAGMKFVVMFALKRVGGDSSTITPGTTPDNTLASRFAGEMRFAAYEYTATGSEGGSLSFTSSESQKSAHIVMTARQINNLEAEDASASGSTTVATSALNPSGWGEKATTWITVAAVSGGLTFTSRPSGYYHYTEEATGTGSDDIFVAAALKNEITESDSPGDWTASSAGDLVAATIALEPGSATAGVINAAARGLYVNGSHCDANKTDFRNAGSYAVWATRAARVKAQWVFGANATTAGAHASRSCILEVSNGEFYGAGARGIFCKRSLVTAIGVNLAGAGAEGIEAKECGIINALQADMRECDVAVFARRGGQAYIGGGDISDFTTQGLDFEDGAIVYAHNVTGFTGAGDTNLSATNAVEANGLIFSDV